MEIINIVKSAHTWIFRLMAAVILTIGGVELNPRLQIEEKLITSWWKRERDEGHKSVVRRK
jgi:uncharacterized membrane protein